MQRHGTGQVFVDVDFADADEEFEQDNCAEPVVSETGVREYVIDDTPDSDATDTNSTDSGKNLQSSRRSVTLKPGMIPPHSIWMTAL